MAYILQQITKAPILVFANKRACTRRRKNLDPLILPCVSSLARGCGRLPDACRHLRGAVLDDIAIAELAHPRLLCVDGERVSLVAGWLFKKPLTLVVQSHRGP